MESYSEIFLTENELIPRPNLNRMTIFNTNKDREAYWEKMCAQYTGDEIGSAVNTLKGEAQLILLLYYGEGKDFKSIAEIMRLSVSVVRNHHNRSMFKLYRYFNPGVIENIKQLISEV